MNKGKGVTLIELIIVISLLCIFFGTMIFSVEKVMAYQNKVQVEASKNNILSFVNNSKLYCRDKFTSGKIIFDIEKNKVKLKIGLRYVDELCFPKGFKLMDVNTNNNYQYLDVDKQGFISDACTISFQDKYKKIYNTTISVGTGYCEIK